MAEERVKEIRQPGPGGRRGMPRPKVANPGKLFKRTFSYVFSHYGVHLVLVVFCIILSVSANIRGTLFTRTLIDSYITPLLGEANPDFGPLSRAMARVAGFYLVGVAAAYTQSRIMIYVSQGTLLRLRTDLFTHMETLPLRYFDTHSHGNIMSVYTNDIDTLRQMVSQSLPQIVNSVITVSSILGSMILLSVPLTMVNLAMVGLVLFLTGKMGRLSGKNFVAQQKQLGELNGFIEEMITGQKVVKVFCHEEENIARFDELNEALCESSFNAQKFANIMGPINAQLGNVSYVLCAVVGGVIALTRFAGFTVGALASFLTFNRNFNMPISQVSMQFNAIIAALAGAERIFALLDEEPEGDEGYVTLVNAREEDGYIGESDVRTGLWAWKYVHRDTGEVEYRRQRGDVAFAGVDFGYTKEKQVLHGISLHAEPGQKIALVGSTGAGKTTITNLINRFYDIQEGKILYDDINIKKIRKADLRRSLGVVLQETHLFTGTVMENIRYGKLDATDEEVYEAARLANADGFIRRLPKGYQTQLTGDGANLSQGQRQLLAIARAAVADPPALILDEATSSIDTRTEKIVQEGMDRLMKGRTTFVIAHRLSTVRDASCILVMEQGQIIERGTHEELLEKKARYYQLYTGKKPEAS